MNTKQVIKFAEEYLAYNAAETGSDEVIRMLLEKLKKRSLSDVCTPEILPEPAWCGHCGGTCRCGEYE